MNDRIHISDLGLPADHIYQAFNELEDNYHLAPRGSGLGDAFRSVGRFFAGKTKYKPSMLLRHLNKVVDVAAKYGKYIPGVGAVVPIVASVAHPFVEKGAKYLESQGRAFVGGSACGGVFGSKGPSLRKCVKWQTRYSNKLGRYVDRCLKYEPIVPTRQPRIRKRRLLPSPSFYGPTGRPAGYQTPTPAPRRKKPALRRQKAVVYSPYPTTSMYTPTGRIKRVCVKRGVTKRGNRRCLKYAPIAGVPPSLPSIMGGTKTGRRCIRYSRRGPSGKRRCVKYSSSMMTPYSVAPRRRSKKGGESPWVRHVREYRQLFPMSWKDALKAARPSYYGKADTSIVSRGSKRKYSGGLPPVPEVIYYK